MELIVVIANLLALTGVSEVRDSLYIENVYKNLCLLSQCRKSGKPQFDEHVHIFANGVIDWETNQFVGWSPKFFVTHRVRVSYTGQLPPLPGP